MYRIRKIVSAFTLVGIVFHEFGHKIFCDLTGVRIYKVCYYRFGNPPGYVIHERPKNFFQSFFISIGPFLTGTLMSLLFFRISCSFTAGQWQKYFFIWLGASIAFHSFPSSADAKGLWNATNRHVGRNLLAIVGYPFALLIWIANALLFFWFDLGYAILLFFLSGSV